MASAPSIPPPSPPPSPWLPFESRRRARDEKREAVLRAAVQLAENLRAKSHQVRVAAQPGEAQTFVIRHGNFASREEAEARGGELGRLGLPNYVVRAK